MSPRVGRWPLLFVLVLTLPALGAAPPKKADQPRLDLHGDPLPKGAIARLGTIRFRHPGAVRSVAFSANGKLIAASSDDKSVVVIWDRATGRRLRTIPAGDHSPSTHLRFSADDRRLHGGHSYGRRMTLYTWDVVTGAVAKDIPRAPDEARILGYSADGREFLLLHKNQEVVRWHIEKGKELGRYPKPQSRYIPSAALVGEQLLMPVYDGRSVAMWDASAKKRLWSEAVARTGRPSSGLSMAFSQDGKVFAAEVIGKAITLFDSRTGKLIRQLKGDVANTYDSLGFSPDGKTLASSNWDGSVRLWDVESGKERAKFPSIGGATADFSFTADSKTFATTNAHAVLLWDATTGKQVESFSGHSRPVSSVSFSPDGQTLATCSSLSRDPVVRLWNPETGRLLASFTAVDSGGVAAVAFSPDGKSLATGDLFGESRGRIWDVATGRERLSLTGHKGGCTCVAYSLDGKRVVSGGAFVDIWDAETGKLLRQIKGIRGGIRQARFTLDGKRVLVAAEGVHVFDAETGKYRGELFRYGRVWGLALSPDGRLLATAEYRGAVRLWELATLREITLRLPNGAGSDVAFAPDGRTLAFRDAEGEVVLFDLPSQSVVEQFPANADHGPFLFSPDGCRLATATQDDSSMLLWDVARLMNRPFSVVAKPSAAELRSWWNDLRDPDPDLAYRAFWRFTVAGEHALPYLAENLNPVKAPESAMVARLIANLDSEEYEVREKASGELKRLGETVAGALRKTKKGAPLEQVLRIDRLLERLDVPISSTSQLRAIRAVAALEQIGGPKARKILETLAAGADGAALTEEAKSSLRRLKTSGR